MAGSHVLRRCLSYNFQSFLTKTHQVSTNGVSLVQQTNYSSDVARILGSLDPKKPARKKTVEVAKVTVITPENKIKVVTMEEAQKLAKVQNSSLMKDESAKKPTYKLVPTNRLYDTDESEEIKEEDSTCDSVPDDKSKRTKDQKLLYTTSIITDHDLNIKIRTATKMLEKKHPVKFVITNSGGDKAPMEKVSNQIVKALSVKFTLTQKAGKATGIKLMFNPWQKDAKKDESSEKC